MKAPQHLIFSTSFEGSTDRVLDWLSFFGHSFKRINTSDVVKQEEDIKISNNDFDVQVKEFLSIWFRKIRAIGYEERLAKEDLKMDDFNECVKIFNEYLSEEEKIVCAFNNLKYSAKNRLSSYFGVFINKLIVLKMAGSCGMEIPDTILTTNKLSLINFIQKHPLGVINKSIDDHLFFSLRKCPGIFSNYTEEITKDIMDEIPNSFARSLFQEKLEKDFEIRTFFIDGQCSSMAIFSQKNTKTKLDFRKYDRETPNRVACYKLPPKLEEKITNFMKKISLNTGSIDLIKTIDGRYVFLEVNSSGQYGMVSYPCNYDIDKTIAKFLIHGKI